MNYEIWMLCRLSDYFLCFWNFYNYTQTPVWTNIIEYKLQKDFVVLLRRFRRFCENFIEKMQRRYSSNFLWKRINRNRSFSCKSLPRPSVVRVHRTPKRFDNLIWSNVPESFSRSSCMERTAACMWLSNRCCLEQWMKTILWRRRKIWSEWYSTSLIVFFIRFMPVRRRLLLGNFNQLAPNLRHFVQLTVFVTFQWWWEIPNLNFASVV